MAKSEGHEGGSDRNFQRANRPPVRVERGTAMTLQQARPSESPALGQQSTSRVTDHPRLPGTERAPGIRDLQC